MGTDEDTVGGRVRRYRLRQGMTQGDLGARLGKTQGWVSKVESGAIELDRNSQVSAVAAALHRHPNDLHVRPYDRTDDRAWQADALAVVRELRRADLSPDRDAPVPTAAGLWLDLDAVHVLRDKAQYRQILAAWCRCSAGLGCCSKSATNRRSKRH